MNRLPGTIAEVETSGSIALVRVAVGAYRFTATLVGSGEEAAAWTAGMPVALLFKDMEVAIAKNLSGVISMRNRMPATVTAIERGRILTRVALDFAGHAVHSVITTGSAQALALAVGDEVEALVKANEMTVAREGA